MASITQTQNSQSPDLLAKKEYSTGTETPSPSKDVRKVLSTWARIRLQLKEPFAEFLGTCLVRTPHSSQKISAKGTLDGRISSGSRCSGLPVQPPIWCIFFHQCRDWYCCHVGVVDCRAGVWRPSESLSDTCIRRLPQVVA